MLTLGNKKSSELFVYQSDFFFYFFFVVSYICKDGLLGILHVGINQKIKCTFPQNAADCKG